MRIKSRTIPLIVGFLSVTSYMALPSSLSWARPLDAQSHGANKVTVTQRFTFKTEGFRESTVLRAAVPPNQAAALRAASKRLLAGDPVPDTFPGGSSDYYPVKCNKPYTWSIPAGSFSYQHACGGSTSPWGWHFSPSYEKRIISSVHESGITWAVVGEKGGHTGAPHTKPSYYLFHGTFNPLHDGNKMSWADVYTYIIVIHGQKNAGTTNIWGYIHQTRTAG
jgi:hypothetical protein